MSASELHLIFAAIDVVLIIVAIARFKFNPFLALSIGALLLGLASGLGVGDTVDGFESGFGDTLGHTAPVIGFGVMLGAILTATGGASRIADEFVGNRSKALIPVALSVAALIIGLPNLFDVSFVMLVPLVYAVARRTGAHLLYVGLPLTAGLYAAHGLLPPHPSPTAAVGAFDASFGLTVLYGVVIAIPTLLICGVLLPRLLRSSFGDQIDLSGGPAGGAAELSETRPSFALSLFVVLLAPVLLVIGSVGEGRTAEGTVLGVVMRLLANADLVLIISVVVALVTLVPAAKLKLGELQSVAGGALKTVGPVILIIGAGGALGEMLTATGVADVIVDTAQRWSISPLILAWALAALLRIALGSATVGTVTAAGIVAPLAAGGSTSPELLALAAASGSVMLSHVNDSGFWLFKEYFQLSVKQTFKTWTLQLSLQSLIGLVGVLVLSVFVSA
ncbi:gluconate:H+ symporter [Brachybacterium kimchii]|uniref:GntP family permease n=1 Tax=Brachybacterium kimchii TaxID=2942909 RepID=A0ABY4N443_9MICO|nr:gluconate:H+ symporter [Brachybacterium kimchii]UQN28891.1 GntP family permease [Brachybacterium kimchii]